MLYDPNFQLSPHYRLKNLTITNQSLSQPNEPTTNDHLNNLIITAEIMEMLESRVGPFTIISGYRTKELQDKLSSAGEPTSATLSFHEIGRAIDIYPTTMSLDDFFGRILADEEMKSQFAEIAVKHSQNSIHLSTNVPGDIRTPKVMGLNEAGIYARLNLDEIASYIAPFMASIDDAYDYAAAQLVTYNRMPLILTASVGLVGATFLLLMPKKARAA